MTKILIALLALANVAALAVLVSLLNAGHADQLTVSDLAYGAVDLDGNGKYEVGDDMVLEWLLRNNPEQVEKALRQAKVNKDGGVDLSTYLLSVEIKTSSDIPK